MQYLVCVGVGKERDERIEWLKSQGFVGEISSNYPFGTIIIEEDYFFGGNITCFSAHVSTGSVSLSWGEWLQIYKKQAHQ